MNVRSQMGSIDVKPLVAPEITTQVTRADGLALNQNYGAEPSSGASPMKLESVSRQ